MPKTTKKRRSSKKKSNTILFLGIAAVLIIALCVILIIVNNGDKRSNNGNVKYETTDKVTESTKTEDTTPNTEASADSETTSADSNTLNPEQPKDTITVIEKTIEKNDVLDGGGNASLDITYPNIPSSEYGEKADIFNDAVVDKIDMIISEYDMNLSDCSDAETMYYTVDYELCKNSDNIVSVLFVIQSYLGGAHDVNTYSALNFNLETGKMLTLDEAVGSGKTDKIASYVFNKISANSSEYYPDITLQSVKDCLNTDNFAITDNGIKVFFQEYDIAPYAAGFQSFDIPLSALN